MSKSTSLSYERFNCTIFYNNDNNKILNAKIKLALVNAAEDISQSCFANTRYIHIRKTLVQLSTDTF